MASSSATKNAQKKRTSPAGSSGGMIFAWMGMALMTALAVFLLIAPYGAHPRYYVGLSLLVILVAAMVSYVGKDRSDD